MGIIDGSHGDRGRADIGAMPAKESLAGTALAVQFDGLAGLPLLAGRPNFPTTPCSNIISAAPKIHHNALGYWKKVARTQREMDMIKARLQHYVPRWLRRSSQCARNDGVDSSKANCAGSEHLSCQHRPDTGEPKSVSGDE